MRVGVVGCGWFGAAHARVYRTIGDAKLVAVADKDEISAKKLAETYHINYYTSVEEMVSKESLDAVSVVVTPQYLFDVTKVVLESGLSVLTEKPIVINRSELSSLSSLVNRGNIFMPGFIELFNPAVIKLKELLDEGAIGRISSISSRRAGRLPKKVLGWKIGVTLDLAIHEIYVHRFLMGDRPNYVQAYTARLLNEGDGEDLAVLISSYRKGVVAIIETNWLTAAGVRQMTITGEDGTISLDYADQSLKVDRKDDAYVPRFRKDEPLYRELLHFVNSVKEDKEPNFNFKFAEEVLNVIFEAVEESVKI
ncbi:MAG: Gfo/Idh/MocA family oxidoreductase [Candidatus Korarchaeum sp.]|nr:Gfo/Idh/MocA family oxidoreductase [Candidatus Korarchaeum sp.]MDW8035936.1 Gfo/Idh/MocA family oxidoreductase [Candidatus Korarchaeum sp.]